MHVSLLSLFVFAVLLGCSTSANPSERIPLMQGKVFACSTQERVVHPASKAAIDAYGEALNDYDSLQLPLYRMVETPRGTVYLAVVMAEPNVDPFAAVVARHRDSVLDHASDATGGYILLRKRGRWYSLAFPAMLTDPRIAMAYASTDSASVRDWHTSREALRRIERE